MIGKTKKILIIGSAPDSVNATKWKNISFDNKIEPITDCSASMLLGNSLAEVLTKFN